MLNQTRSFVCAAALSAFLSAGTTAQAAPPGAAITYQGQLSYLDIPVTTTADLRFRLYDDAGVQLGDEIRVEGVDLIEGEFEAVLDFGLANTSGWIEVDVRSPAGEGEYITLSPRQRISTLAPVFGEGTSLNAEGASTPEGASGGQGLISLRPSAGEGGDVGLGDGVVAGTGQGERPGQGVDAGGGSRGAGWLMSGSTVFYNGGNVGIGTNAPDAGLHVTGAGARTAHIENTQVAGGNFGLQVEAGGATSRAIFARANRTVGQNYGVFGQSLSSRGTGVFGQAASTFGITYGVTGVSRAASGTGVRGLATNPTGSTVGVLGQVTSPDGIAVQGVGGSIAVHGSTDSTFAAVFGQNTTTGAGVTSTPMGMYGQTVDDRGWGVYGESLGSGPNAHGVVGATGSATGYGGYFFGSGGGLGLRSDGGLLVTGPAVDATVQLPDGAINALELLNEPGIANIKVGILSTLSTSFENVTSRSITVPAAGYILALMHGQITHDHVNGADDSIAVLGVSNSSAQFENDNNGQYYLDMNLPTGFYISTVTSSAVYSVAAGTHTYFVVGRKLGTQTTQANDVNLTLLYVPTAYGTVSLSTPPPPPVDEPALLGALTPVADGTTEADLAVFPGATAPSDGAPSRSPSKIDLLMARNAELEERLMMLEQLILGEGE